MRSIHTQFELCRFGASIHLTTAWILVAMYLFSACAKTSDPGGSTTGTSTPPNIVLIVADDMAWGDMSAHANTNLSTNNLDRMVKEGLSFSNFYVSAVCSPTRAELLTGKHALNVGVTGTGAGRERINLGVELLPEVLAKAGYRNGLFGKWHNGSQGPYHPLSRGFDQFYGFTSGHWGSYFNYFIEEGDSLTRFEGYLPNVLTSRAIDFMGKQKERPTFTMLSFPTPHSPMQVPDRWFKPFENAKLDSIGNGQGEENQSFSKAALAMVANIDWNVGRVLHAIDSLSMTDNTIVIFMSDNGPNSWRWNAGMRGRKGSVDEGGIRSPLLVYSPGMIAPAQISTAPISVRTLHKAIQVVATEENGDLHLFERLLKEDSTPIINQWRDKLSVRSAHHRLDNEGRLYDITVDREQRYPLTDRPSLRDSLQRLVDGFRDSIMKPNLVDDTRPFPVGYSSLFNTLLPARDASSSGNVTRSNRWPNDSYFHEWNDKDASISWSIEVLDSGNYWVDLYYALSADSNGVSVKFTSSQGTFISSTIEAHITTQEGHAHDRMLREESYVKNWKKVNLGSLQLYKGADTLSLGADLVTGSVGPEVWAVMIKRERVGE